MRRKMTSGRNHEEEYPYQSEGQDCSRAEGLDLSVAHYLGFARLERDE